MVDEKKWALAWAKFDALYKNLPISVTADRVADFHAILDLLQQASGEDLSPFRVPDSEVKPQPVSTKFIGGGWTYSTMRYCNRNYLLTQMDAVRGYFENLQPPPKKTQVGF